jgi:hypothetical protein
VTVERSHAELVWIFGFGRSGSTWLASLLGRNERTTVWLEPLIGLVFGRALNTAEPFVTSPAYVLGGPPQHRLPPVRAFVEAAIAARYPGLAGGDVVVLKEQNASIGAPILSESFPESRFVLLVRDPRDVLASVKDTLTSPRGWAREMQGAALPEFDVEAWTGGFAQAMDVAVRAFDGHAGPKTIVRYEDLRAAPVETLHRLSTELRWPFADERIRAAVAELSWDALPETEKGPGKFHRKASPGSWVDDLTPSEIEAAERHGSAVLERFYGGSPRK